MSMFLDLLWDAALVTGFGVQHSVLATLRAKKVIRQFSKFDPLSWRGPQSFFNVLYVVIAACLWRPVDYVVWEFTGLGGVIMTAILVAGWVWYFQIHVFEYDCGLAFGSTPNINRFLGRKAPMIEMWKTGFRRWSRFPVHTAFFPMFLAFPTMTADLLVLGVVGNLYNWIGTVLYDRRLMTLVGKPYYEYIDKTGLIFPPVIRNRAGAASLTLPEPTHWKRPLNNLPGIAIGILGGFFYWFVLGNVELSPAEVWKSWGVSFALAILGGILYSVVNGPQLIEASRQNFDRFQTRVSTNTALISAVSILTWFTVSTVRDGNPPTLAVILPMWLTVLWIGHAASVATLALSRKLATSSVLPEPREAS
jgi:methanethiol S-methyltransferase